MSLITNKFNKFNRTEFLQRVAYAFCLFVKSLNLSYASAYPGFKRLFFAFGGMLRCLPQAEATRSNALRDTLKTWLKPVTGPVSGSQSSLWLPLGILFSTQTLSFDEICSVCLHRCRCLNGKLKTCKVFENFHPAPQGSKFHCKLVTKNFKTSCLSKRTRGLYFLVLCCDTFARENYSSRTSMCDHLT